MTYYLRGHSSIHAETTEVTLKVASLAPGQPIIWDSHPQKIPIGEVRQNARGGIIFHYTNDAFKRLINFDDTNKHSSLDGTLLFDEHRQQTHMYTAGNIVDFTNFLPLFAMTQNPSQNLQSNRNNPEEKRIYPHHRLN